MSLTLLLIVSSLLTLHGAYGLKHLQEPRRKSFEDAKLECVEYLFISNESLHRYDTSGYPDELSVRKLINCVIENLKAWDEQEQQIKDYVFHQFFSPSTVDCQYKLHTKQCLEQNVSPLDKSDRLGRAYKSFLCYYQNYGGIRDEVGWVPYTFSEIEQVLVDSIQIVPHSHESLVEYCKGRVLEPPEHPDLAYAYVVRLGFYNETTGFDLEKLVIQFGDLRISDDESKACVSGIAEQYCKEPDRLANTILQCLAKYVPIIKIVSSAARTVLGNPAECVVPPKAHPKTQPCYNGPC